MYQHLEHPQKEVVNNFNAKNLFFDFSTILKKKYMKKTEKLG